MVQTQPAEAVRAARQNSQGFAVNGREGDEQNFPHIHKGFHLHHTASNGQLSRETLRSAVLSSPLDGTDES